MQKSSVSSPVLDPDPGPPDGEPGEPAQSESWLQYDVSYTEFMTISFIS